MRNVVVTIDDPTPPRCRDHRRLGAAPGWHRGDQDAAGHGVGCGGHRRGRDVHRRRACGPMLTGSLRLKRRSRPCSDRSGSVTVPTHHYATRSDGHVADRDGLRPAGNVSRTHSRDPHRQHASRPGARRARSTEEMAGARTTASRSAGATLSQSAAPIAARATRSALSATSTATSQGCVEGTVRGTRHQLGRRTFASHGPASGGLKLWLEDEAGNADRERAVRRRRAPLRRRHPDAAASPRSMTTDPTRVRVVAKRRDLRHRGRPDRGAAGRARMRGGRFRPVSTTVASRRRSTTRRFPRAATTLRARAVDRAGNERSIAEPAERRAGDAHACRCASPRDSPSASPEADPGPQREGQAAVPHRAAGQPAARAFGRTIPLRGRLTMPGGNPLAGADDRGLGADEARRRRTGAV